jgi:predicted CoA-substrate-specific enzyme activase
MGEIAFGLCLALARNFQASVLKGKAAVGPVALAGGGALNPGLVRAFREVLELGDEDLAILPDPLFAGAAGAARLAEEAAIPTTLEEALATLRPAVGSAGTGPDATSAVRAAQPCAAPEAPSTGSPSGRLDAYLGIDVGSVSTDLVLLGPRGDVIDGIYVPTRGRPVDVLEEALLAIHDRDGARLRVLGVGTTGSGRHLAARLVGADLVKNEISAQLRGALHYVPDADTIFEIGGQDSKYVRVESGRLRDFTMNKVCAAGTGSFLEEQCELLGIDVKRDFAGLAAESRQRLDLGARCTVFMETELQSAARRGAQLPDLVAALAESVARNYLEKVVGARPVGTRIVFQGGVASNAAVVAAFERLLGRPVAVHPHNTLSGAIGAALLAREWMSGRATRFKGLTSIGAHSARAFACQRCENLCEVTRLSVAGQTLHFGDRCERYTITDGDAEAKRPRAPDLFAEREDLLAQATSLRPSGPPRGVIGLPRASLLLEHLPFWSVFFTRLGYEIRVSPPSNMRLLEKGARHLSAETCLPIKMAFGHVAALREAGVDAVFFPSVVAIEDPERPATHGCPYSQAAPFMVRAGLRLRLLAPEIALVRDAEAFARGMRPVAEALGLGEGDVSRALEAAWRAQDEVRARLIARGREVLAGSFERALVVVGRPYNLFDPFLNLNLSRHLSRLGVVAIPQSFLPEDDIPLPGAAGTMPWRFPREAVRTAMWAERDPRLHPVLVTNFGCGPDAFLVRHITRALPEHDLLVLEFDEHRGEAGMITRLEAFLDRIDEGVKGGRAVPDTVSSPPARSAGDRLREQKIYIPYFADQAYAFAGALRYVGADAEVLPPPDDAVRATGERAGSGKECHAYSMLLGDALGVARRHAQGPRVSFLYPGTSMPCLLAQFSTGFELDLARERLRNVSVIAPASRQMIDLFGLDGATQLWRGLVTADLLTRWTCQTRPYERDPGATDQVHHENLVELARSLADDDLDAFCRRAEERMRSVATRKTAPRPLVGVAGDVYTRANGVANLDLWRNLEALGCEVWPAPLLVDIVDFGLPDEVDRSLQAGEYSKALAAGLLTARKAWTAWPLRRRFGRLLARPDEPGHARTIELASRYVGARSQQLLLLNVAKIVDFARRGADGIVNAMCLNCMLGTASAALLDRIREDHGGIPIANLVYAGTETAALQTKLETFVHQVEAHHRTRPAVTPQAPAL